jgi:archaellum component FlaC
MRLWEFDVEDRSAHIMIDKKHRTIEERMGDIEDWAKSAKDMFANFKKYKQGRKSAIEDILIGINNDIIDFHDFCNNNSNDDEETRRYLDRLKELYTEVDDMLDNI